MASKYMNIFPVPNNFEDILNDFAKEVIRNQPKDIIDFGCYYFNYLLEQRDIKPKDRKPLDYQFKGDILPCDKYEPKLIEAPHITYAQNSLTVSQEDVARLKTSMDNLENLKKYDIPLREEKFGTREGYGKIRENIYQPNLSPVKTDEEPNNEESKENQNNYELPPQEKEINVNMHYDAKESQENEDNSNQQVEPEMLNEMNDEEN